MSQKRFVEVIVLLIVFLMLAGVGVSLLAKRNNSTSGITNKQSSTTPSQQTGHIYLNYPTNKFISKESGFSFEYPSEYYLIYKNITAGFDMGVAKGDANRESFYGGLAVEGDNSNTKYKREYVTQKGYSVKQVLTIKSIDHPQGLGTVNTTIYSKGDTDKKMGLVAFIELRLLEIQKEKNIETLTERGYIEILDDLKVNNQIIESFNFE